MHEVCVCHTGFLAQGNIKSEVRGRSRPKDNSRRAVRDIDIKNVGTRGKSPKQVLTSVRT